jgi:capsular polysaccharide transport system permease protein
MTVAPVPVEKPARELTKPVAKEAPPLEPLPQPPAPARSTAETAKQLRRARARRLLWRLSWFVVLPTVIGALYYGFFATSQYESYSVFTIHSADTRPALAIESLLSGVGSGSTGRDALSVRDYVLSRDMLAKLDKEHGFIAHYRSPSVDWISRLGADTSFEDAYEYFEDKVHADFDMTSGALTLRVRAFSAKKAHEFARAVLTYSEEMVNKLSERERHDRTHYAEVQVGKAEQRLTQSRKALLDLQRKHSEFNPLETAGAALTLRTQLEGELAKARAELMELKAFMQADAPRVKAAEERVRSISAQVGAETRRMVDPVREGGLNSSLPEFEAAMIEKEFAQKSYEAAMAALEIARSDAVRQHRYLATIASPSTPDESTHPRRWLSTVIVFVVSFLLLGIGTLISAAVREHARL